MKALRIWIILSWTALPIAMFGGASLLRRFVSLDGGPTPFQAEWLRAGHAHGNILIVTSFLYYTFLDQTSLSASVKNFASGLLFSGILAQSGGFFLHAILGQPQHPSIGTAVTLGGAFLLATAVIVLVYGLMTLRPASAAAELSVPVREEHPASLR